MNFNKIPFIKNIPEWNKLAVKMKMELAVKGKDNFKKDFENRYFSGRFPRTSLEMSAIWQLYNHIKKIDTLDLLNKIQESEKGNPQQIKIKENDYSWDWLQAIEEFYSIINEFKIDTTKHITICEIGAGYGRLAEVFLKVFKNVKYIIVDIEPTLDLAKWYLDDKRVVCINPYDKNFPKALKSKIDLFINVDSFQEMGSGIIANYFDIMIRTGYKYIYLKNAESGVHNLCNTLNFNLIHYPEEVRMKIIKQRRSLTAEDMVEQFIIKKV